MTPEQENQELRANLAMATEALEFYSDKDNWDDDDFTPTIWDDGNIDLGHRAKEALSKISQKPKAVVAVRCIEQGTWYADERESVVGYSPSKSNPGTLIVWWPEKVEKIKEAIEAVAGKECRNKEGI